MFRTQNFLFIAAVLAAPLSLAPNGNANAEEPGIRVSYSDLDLTTETGAKKLYARIHTAAGRYCENLYSRTGSRIANGYDECVVDAVNNTVHALNVPTLSALHADRGKPQRKS